MPKAKDKRKITKHDSETGNSQITNKESCVTNFENGSRKQKKDDNATLIPSANITKSKMLQPKTSTPRRKTMPSLAELEKLCEDADDEELCLKQDDELDAFLMTYEGIKELSVKIEKCLNELKSSNMSAIVPPKRRKLQTPSHSTWSTHGMETTEKVNDAVETHSNGSVDSNKTLNYDINNISPIVKKQHKYHFIPSTSKNESVFLHNDEVFYKSIMGIEPEEDNLNYYCAAPDTEYEIPCETIILQDDAPNCDFNARLTENMEISESPNYLNYFNPVDFNESLIVESDPSAVIDVDEVIAENKAVLDRHRISNIGQYGTIAPNQMYNFEIIDEETPAQNEKKNVEPKTSIVDIISLDDSELDIAGLEKKKVPHGESKNSGNQKNSQIPDDIKFIAQWKVNDNDASLITLSSDTSMSRHRPYIANNNSVVFVSESKDNNNNKMKRKKNLTTHTTENNLQKIKQQKTCHCDVNTKISNINNEKCKRAPSTATRMIGECPICMDNLATTVVAATICGHIFCMNCIKMTIKNNGKKCPTCRLSLGSKNSYHQLFL